jgi:hypothetical protein
VFAESTAALFHGEKSCGIKPGFFSAELSASVSSRSSAGTDVRWTLVDGARKILFHWKQISRKQPPLTIGSFDTEIALVDGLRALHFCKIHCERERLFT